MITSITYLPLGLAVVDYSNFTGVIEKVHEVIMATLSNRAQVKILHEQNVMNCDF